MNASALKAWSLELLLLLFRMLQAKTKRIKVVRSKNSNETTIYEEVIMSIRSTWS